MNYKKIKLRFLQLFVFIEFTIIFCFCKLFRIKNDEVWLISERGDEARDNGYAFYKYIKQTKKSIKVKYVISKKSNDVNKIAKEDIVYLRSIKHYILFITAGRLISTHIMGYSPEMRLFNKLDSKLYLRINGKRVFLQHGITKDNIFDASKFNIDLFICGAKPEYDFLLKTSGFSKDVLKYTGFPRYDNLKRNNKKFILIMPTWRTTLFYCNTIEEFKKSEYYKKWYYLLNNEELKEYLLNKNIKIIFYPHYELQSFAESFSINNDNIIIAKKEDYDVQELLNNCSMLVTDYSSVYFDIAYLRKPLIYYHFDYNEYRQSHYREGWFNYHNDGFGPVVVKNTDVVKKIINYCDNDFKVEPKYINRTKKVFTYSDQSNSERVYKEIVEM